MNVERKGGNTSALPESSSPQGSIKAAAATIAEMSREEKLEAAQKQLEYYFSAENLRKDAYLTSQMDAQKSVAIGVVMKFAKMKALIEKDADTLREAVKASNAITLSEDGERIICLLKDVGGSGGSSNRNTIILREAPSDVTEEEIKEVFAFEGCPPVVKVRADVGDCWFVEMETEDAARDALINLKKNNVTLRGEAVKARFKNDTTVRSYYSQPSPSMPQPGVPMANMPRGAPPGAVVGGGFIPFSGFNPHGGYMMAGFQPGAPLPQGYPGAVNPMGVIGVPGAGQSSGPVPIPMMPPMNGAYNMKDSSSSGSGGGQRGQRHNNYHYGNVADGEEAGPGGGGKRDRGGAAGSQYDKSGSGNNSGNNNNSTNGTGNGRGGGGGANTANNRAESNRGKGKAGGNTRNEGRNGGGKGAGGRSSNSHTNHSGSSGGGYVVNESAFPALSAVSEKDAPIPAPGFRGDYKKYSHDEIVEIVSHIKEVQAPVGLDGLKLDPSVHGYVLATEPNPQLLLRQRSFTMDETREQLKQGRPVVRDGITVAGATGADMTTRLEFGDPRSRHGSVDLTHQASSNDNKDGTTTLDQGKELADEAINTSIDGVAAYLASKTKLESATATATATGSVQLSHKPATVPSHSTWAALAAKAAATQTDPAPTASKGTSSSPPVSGKVAAARPPEGSSAKGSSSGEKLNDASGDGKKSGGAASEGKDKKRSGREKTRGSGEGSEPAKKDNPAPPMSWGGRSTFANILKSNASTSTQELATSTGTQSEAPIAN